VIESDTWERLRHFRQALYDDLGLRQDSLFELLDAMLTSPQRSTLVRHSLSTMFRRRWPSTCDALSDGSIDTARLRGLFAGSLAGSAEVEGRPVWVIDGTNWPRPAARASADRTWEYRPLPGWPQNGVVPAWSYQWLAAVPEMAGSWVLPLEVRRRGPTAKSATQVAPADLPHGPHNLTHFVQTSKTKGDENGSVGCERGKRKAIFWSLPARDQGYLRHEAVSMTVSVPPVSSEM
jgi:hypothetical protein